MDNQSTPPSGIAMVLRQLGGRLEASSTVGAGEKRLLSPRGSRDRSLSEARIFMHLSSEDEAGRTPAIDIDTTEVPTRNNNTCDLDNGLRDFCRGQPPRRSFLAPGGRTPPRFRMSRRSTLADKPELDGLLKAVMVTYKGEDFLSLDNNTVHHLSQYLNGSKPVAHTCLFKRLMITSEANKVRADRFVAALEQVGVYCEHVAIIAPFHTIEFGNIFNRETDTLEAGSDWEKILQCFPNLHTLIFEHPADEPTNLTRDTFYALSSALANNTTLQKIEKVQLDVPSKVLFDYHHDYHNHQQRSDSPRSFSVTSSPLTIVGSDMVYADGTKDFGQLEDEDSSLFGVVDAIDAVDR